ncbi:hypothetical protein ACV1DG_22340, partial [Aeromonas hydrophila]
MLRMLLLLFVSFGASSHEIKYSKDDGEVYVMNGEVKKSYLFTRTGLTASVLPGWDNLSSRCT